MLLTWVVPLHGEPSVTGYEYRFNGGDWMDVDVMENEMGTCGSVITCVQVEELTNGQRYVFDVRAVNVPEGQPTLRKVGPVVTKMATPFGPPEAPATLTATPGNGQVTLKWTAPTNNGGSPVTRYEYKVDGSGEWTDTGSVTAREVTVTELTNGQPYTFYVRAVNARGPGGSVTAPLVTPSRKPPQPVNLRATPDDGKVTLTWEAPGSNDEFGIERYEYRWCRVDDSGDSGSCDGDWDTAAPNSIAIAVTELTNGQPYTFEVRAVNEQGEGMAATATATPSVRPSVPRHVNATPGDGQVTLTWAAPSYDGGSDITGYRYRYRIGDSGDSGDCKDWTDVGLALTETVTSLTNGTEYYGFQVCAVNARGAGPVKTVMETPSRKPSQPDNLNATPGNGQVILTWIVPSSDGGSPITYYEYRVDGSGSWIGTETVLSATVMDLENGRSVPTSRRGR